MGQRATCCPCVFGGDIEGQRFGFSSIRNQEGISEKQCQKAFIWFLFACKFLYMFYTFIFASFIYIFILSLEQYLYLPKKYLKFKRLKLWNPSSSAVRLGNRVQLYGWIPSNKSEVWITTQNHNSKRKRRVPSIQITNFWVPAVSWLGGVPFFSSAKKMTWPLDITW